MKASVFSQVQSASKNLDAFITRDDFFMVFTEKEEIFFYVIVFKPN